MRGEFSTSAGWDDRSYPPCLWRWIPQHKITERATALELKGERAAGGLWQNLRLWYWLTLGAGSLLAAACAALIFVVMHRPAAPPIPHMAATITETNGQVGWTATMDIGKARMIVVPEVPRPMQSGRKPEHWLIPPRGRPIAVSPTSPIRPRVLPWASGR